MSFVSPDYTNGRSANQTSTVDMKTTSTITKTRKPLGDLSYFLREIRDEIYQYVLSRKYKAFYSCSIVRPTGIQKTDLQIVDIPIYHNLTASNLSILRLSKAIKDEAMSIFYSEGTFRFYYSPRLGQSYLKEGPQIPNFDVISRMTNIEIIYDTQINPIVFSTQTASSMYAGAPAGPLEFFRGSNVSRRFILIVLRLCGWAAYCASEMTKSPLFRSLKEMTGLKNMTLRFITNGNVYCSPQIRDRIQSKEWVLAGEWDKLYAGFTPLFTAMRKDLEPSLGKSSAMSELVPGESMYFDPNLRDRFEVSGQREIVFHPSDHLAAKSKANKSKMNKSKTNKDTLNSKQSVRTTELTQQSTAMTPIPDRAYHILMPKKT